ncbi:MAG: MBL fold metallo-hydrolase [Rikenellaceae bacterium]|jgi:L-ascorbate metabolism protein UlaG (beta-lactamase superfamily)|nr:MBL fold metallo-hydrolase [Rikenellaceae bacterium]
MKKVLLSLLLLAPMAAIGQPLSDTYPTSAGDVEITLVGHGTLMIRFDGQVIHIDPYSQVADYAAQPDADLVLITHEHPDHYDAKALEQVVTPASLVIANTSVGSIYERTNRILANGESTEWNGVKIEAVPAYNIIHERTPGQAYHPKGVGNGYLLTFGDFRLYVAGDTEPIPEMEALKGVDVAFLPKNLPFTMSDEEFVEAARTVAPRVLYPYHYNSVDKKALQEALPGIVIR